MLRFRCLQLRLRNYHSLVVVDPNTQGATSRTTLLFAAAQNYWYVAHKSQSAEMDMDNITTSGHTLVNAGVDLQAKDLRECSLLRHRTWCFPISQTASRNKRGVRATGSVCNKLSWGVILVAVGIDINFGQQNSCRKIMMLSNGALYEASNCISSCYMSSSSAIVGARWLQKWIFPSHRTRGGC